MEVVKMEWLKELLEKAKITDGKLNVDEVMEAAKKEFPKHAVPKNVFNDKCEELNTANETIITLKKENGDNEELQNKIKDYETEIGNLKAAAVKRLIKYIRKYCPNANTVIRHFDVNGKHCLVPMMNEKVWKKFKKAIGE